MLELDARAVLIDALRPPPGMALERAVGTSFSLDLEALLIAPVAFALFDIDLGEPGQATDPISLLEAVRRHADKIDIFCQAGQIGVPRYQPVLSLLEGSVHAVPSRRGRIFHPKVWVLKFRERKTGVTHLRVLCLSRNLTFDRSWDTILRLEQSSDAGEGDGKELSAFLRGLAGDSLQPLPAERAAAIEALADDLTDTRFDAPRGFDQLRFLPMGPETQQIERVTGSQRILIVAPFISTRTLQRLVADTRGSILISRQEGLDQIPADTLDRFQSVYVLDPNAHGSTENTPAVDEMTAERPGFGFSGLHAKLYVCETGSQATVFTGSTNATDAGFGGNVELMVQLHGEKRNVGINTLLQSKDKGTSLLDLLAPYHPSDTDPPEPTPSEIAQHRVEMAGLNMAGIPLRANVQETGTDAFDLDLTSRRRLQLKPEMTVRWWPITRPADAVAQTAPAGQRLDLTWEGLSLSAITAFFGFEISTKHADGTAKAIFVATASLHGAPEERRRQVVTAHLGSRADVIRYLLLLLADFGSADQAAWAARLIAGSTDGGHDSAYELPLLETMVRALADNPDSLDHVARLLDDLKDKPELLPEGFDEVWPPIWAAREALR